MSDDASVQRAAAVSRALEDAPGAPMCECALHAIFDVAASAGSSSRTRSGGSASGHSSHNSDNEVPGDGSDSEVTSDTGVPSAVFASSWSGLGIAPVEQCAHGRTAHLKKAWGGRHSGRRFLDFPIKDEGRQCQFVEWMEIAWLARCQKVLKAVWRELKACKRVEAQAHESFVEALQLNEVIKAEKKDLEEEVARTKMIAERVCTSYHKKTVYAVVDKTKMQFLVYCLLGVIFFLLAFIFLKMK